MPKISVVDISDPDRFQEIYNEDNEKVEDIDSNGEGEDLGLVPRIIFSTLSTLTILVPLVSVHIALDILVHQQYAQDVDILEIAARAATAAIGTYQPFFSP
jgi:hypothetical protein